MSVEPVVLRQLDACSRCKDRFSQPPLPGCNAIPKYFLKAVAWAYHCDGCLEIVLREMGYGLEGAKVFGESLSCLKCLKSLEEAFKVDKETAGRKVNHPKASSYLTWCDDCITIIVEALKKPVEHQVLGDR